MTSPTHLLDEKRARIDAFDDAIIDLLVQRTEVVEEVGKLKHAMGLKAYIKPAREAQVVRRVLARAAGRLPVPLMVQLYRELMMASLQLEEPFRVATLPPLRALARDAFGISTPFITCTAASEVVRRVNDGEALLGLVPLPQASEAKPWWQVLASFREGTPNVVFRLPILANSHEEEALVIGCVPFEASGDDVSVLYIEGQKEASPRRIEALLAAEGLPVVQLHHHTNADMVQPMFLAFVQGYIASDDARLDALRARKAVIAAVASRGGYATSIKGDAPIQGDAYAAA
jgi:chorismate mutase